MDVRRSVLRGLLTPGFCKTYSRYINNTFFNPSQLNFYRHLFYWKLGMGRTRRFRSSLWSGRLASVTSPDVTLPPRVGARRLSSPLLLNPLLSFVDFRFICIYWCAWRDSAAFVGSRLLSLAGTPRFRPCSRKAFSSHLLGARRHSSPVLQI